MELFEKAIAYACEKHNGAVRKIDAAPYILHPIEVAQIVSTMTLDREVLSAAVLHDTVEDTDACIDEIEALFGARVASLVASETENKRPGIPKAESWRIRKEESLAELRGASDIGIKYLWLGDKLSNLRGMHRAFVEQGYALFNCFNQKDPAQHEWYYHSVLEALSELSGTDAWKELSALVSKIFGEDKHDQV